MADPDLFVTQNLYQAAYCLCRGFQLIGKRRQTVKCSVIFQGHNVAQEAMTFYNHGTVEAKAYSDAYRTLKDYVFER